MRKFYKRMRSGFIFVLITWMFCQYSTAQDVAFSQRYVTSPYLNPALTGIFNGSVRVNAQYRNQWANQLDFGFQSFAASGDINYGLKLFKNTNRDLLGLGIYFVNDRVDGIDFNTNLISLSGAFHKSLNPKNTHYLGFGFQFGVLQKNINYEQTTFGDQFNHVDAYSFPTSEPVPANNFAVEDLSIGLLHLITPVRNVEIQTGIAFHHLTVPNLSFFRFSEIYDRNSLVPKFTFHSAASIKTGAFTHFLPRLVITAQNPFVDIELGANMKFASFSTEDYVFHAGVGTHIVRDLESVALATVVPFIGVQVKNLLMGMSYDVGINQIYHHKRNFSSFEFSVSYLGENENEALFCPRF